MNDNPDLKIEIAGHTDNQGNSGANQILSENRAKAVKIFLLDPGSILLDSPTKDMDSLNLSLPMTLRKVGSKTDAPNLKLSSSFSFVNKGERLALPDFEYAFVV